MYKRLVTVSVAMILGAVGTAAGQKAEAPKVASWSNSKTGNQKTVFQVKPGEKVTFSVKAEGAEKFVWLLDGTVQEGQKDDSFTWTAPNKKGFWKILVKTTNRAREKWAQDEMEMLKRIGWIDRITSKYKVRFIRDMVDFNIYPEEARAEWIVAPEDAEGTPSLKEGSLRPVGAVRVGPASTTGWESEKALNYVGEYWEGFATPSLGFDVTGDGKWVLICGAGDKRGRRGFYWDGAKWVSDQARVKGLTGVLLAPTLVRNLTGDGKWTLIARNGGGNFSGYHWDRTKWVSDPARVKGLDVIRGRASHTILDDLKGDGKFTLISGTNQGAFKGYYWDGNKWVSDASRVAGLGNVGGRSKLGAGFDVFGDKKWTLIAGNVSGAFTGYYWDGKRWVKDSSRVKGLGHGRIYGGDASVCMAYNLLGDKKWVLIAGYDYSKRCGFFCNTVSKEDIPLIKEEVTYNLAATAARIRWKYDKTWNHRVKYSARKDMSDALWSDWHEDSNSADIHLHHLTPQTTYYYEAYTYVPWAEDAYARSSVGSFTTPPAQGYIRLKPGESIEDAIKFLHPEGGVVELLPGIHDVHKTVVIDRSNVVIYGTREAVVRHHDRKADCFVVPTLDREDTDPNLFHQNITFRGFTTASTYTAGHRNRMIYVRYAKNITVENIHDTSYARMLVLLGTTPSRRQNENIYYKNNIMEHSGMYGYYCTGMYQINNTLKAGGSMGTELGISNLHIIGNQKGADGYMTIYKGSGPRNVRNNVLKGGRIGIHIGSGINDVLIINNTITGTEHVGILSRPQSLQRNNLIINNRIYNNSGHGFWSPTYFSEAYGSESILKNNVIYNNGGDGIRLDNEFWKLLKITDNIIVNNKGYGINCTATKSKVVSRYNNVWQNAKGNYNRISAGTGDISDAPLFANPTRGDFRLKSKAGRWDPKTKKWVKDDVHSPCIDAGDPKAECSREPAPNGGRVNMGTYGNTREASKSG